MTTGLGRTSQNSAGGQVFTVGVPGGFRFTELGDGPHQVAESAGVATSVIPYARPKREPPVPFAGRPSSTNTTTVAATGSPVPGSSRGGMGTGRKIEETPRAVPADKPKKPIQASWWCC
ncbi:unnamed protein product [Amoebophrya sp. A25]|nr:unnamed protein product [Amoebophrya sp. A25]|eukprot:GSA25T00015997001.1